MKLKWNQAPVKTQWGHDMVVADVAIDKDHTVSLYCEREQTAKVETMFARTAQQQEPLLQEIARLHDRIKDLGLDVEFLSRPASKPWVEIAPEELLEAANQQGVPKAFAAGAAWANAKLLKKNA